MREYERGQLRLSIPPGAGEVIRAARLGRQWTQDRLALRSAVSRKTIIRIERGSRPDADTLMRICEALGLRILDLVPAWGRPEDDGQIPGLSEPLIGYRLRQRRRKLGVALKVAAAAAGISVSTLSRFERLASASPALLKPVYPDDPEGAVRLDNDGLAKALGFDDSASLDEYCRAP